MLIPSERISLITEIGRRLSREEWSLLDLTLRQFKLPSTDMWDGTKESYVIQMIDRADDDVLVGLATHLGYEISKPSAVAPSFWEQGRFRLFITHLAAQKTDAAELQGALRNL